MIERRRHHRGRVLFGAAVDFNRRQSTLDCIIRNVSAEGAKIVFSGGMPIPDHVHLTIRHRGETVPARTVWQRGNEAGLAFDREQAEPDRVIDFAAHRRAIKRRIDGFLTDDTAGVGLDSMLVLLVGSGVATGIAYAANHAIETQFNTLLTALRLRLD